MDKVWITRAEPGAQATAERVNALGFEPLVEPLLEVRSLGEGSPDIAGAAALAFTSANGVAAFATRSKARDLPVFAVGAATARSARDAGFADVTSADGDVDALARLIVSQRTDLAGEVLHLSAEVAAGDLIGALNAAAVPARRLVLYETAARKDGPAARAALAQARFVLLHSPRAAGVLRGRLATRPAPTLLALCLSPAVAGPLVGAPLAGVEAAQAPTEAALLQLLTHGAEEARALRARADCGTKARS
jgi:uroporphyrinogen-III synthase